MGKLQYKEGDLVLAKVKGYPPWPAEIVNPVNYKQQPKEGKIFVFFFKPRQVRFCTPDEVTPFSGDAKEVAIARTRAKGCLADFKEAIADCLGVEQKRVASKGAENEGILTPEVRDKDEEAEGSEDEEEENDEDDEEEDAEEEDEEEHDETPKKRKHARKTSKAPAKRAKTGIGAAIPKPLRPNKKTPVSKEETMSLFETMKRKRGAAIERAAQVWASQYEENADDAVAQLLTFLFQTCGTDFVMESENPQEEADVDEVVQKMVESARLGNVEDYLGGKQKELKLFKENMLRFWDSLVLECQENILFDQKLIDKCIDYVIALACTSPRTFRHAATLVGLQLVTSFVSVAKTLGETRETMQRQLNAETRKRTSGPKVESLTKSLTETHEKITLVEEMMRKLFRGVFMHRYRDVDPEIRSACISALGSWIQGYSTLFLQDLYLKYIGWTLNDKNAGVRSSAISALHELYSIDDNIPALSLFTERFLSRMVGLADDIDISIAVKAIDLLKQLLRQEILGEDDMASLHELLVDESARVREAIGEMVYEQRVAAAPPRGADASASKGRKASGSSEGQIKQLLQIVGEYADSPPVLSLYVVDALWKSMDAMQDWKCMAKMLLSDSSKDELSDEEAASLVLVLSAAVRKAVGEKLAPSLEAKKPHLTKAQRDALESSRHELTSALMKPLPQILRKFLADKSKVRQLAEVVLHLDLELFSIKRQESSFAATVELLKEAFFRHGDEETVGSCVRALAFCAREGHAELKDAAQHMLSQTGAELLVKLQAVIRQTGGPENEEEEEYALLVNLRRAHQYQLAGEALDGHAFGSFTGLLEDFSNLDQEVTRLTLLNMLLQVLWAYHALDLQKPEDGEMRDIVSKRNKLLVHLEASLDSLLHDWEDTPEAKQFAAEVVYMLSDVWAVFSAAKLKGSKVEDLSHSPSDIQLRHFWTLCATLLSAAPSEEEMREEEEGGEGEEGAHGASKEKVMAAAAKLVAHDLVPKEYLAPEIVSHMLKQRKVVSEMVKAMFSGGAGGGNRSSSRDAGEQQQQQGSSLEQWELYLEALKRAYARYMEAVGGDDGDGDEEQQQQHDLDTSAAFVACRELAARLAATYAFAGRASAPLQASLRRLVRAGVDFAFDDAPQCLSFLEAAMAPFVPKLAPESCRAILEQVEKKVEGVETDEDPSAWRPYANFVELLREKLSRKEGQGHAGVAADEGDADLPRRRGRARRSPARERDLSPAPPADKPRRRAAAAASVEEVGPAEAEEEEEQEEDIQEWGAEEEEEEVEDDETPLYDVRRRRQAAARVLSLTQTQPEQAAGAAPPVLQYVRKRKGAPRALEDDSQPPRLASSGATPQTTDGSRRLSQLSQSLVSASQGSTQPLESRDVAGSEELVHHHSFVDGTEEALPSLGRKRSRLVLPPSDSPLTTSESREESDF